MNIKSFFRLVVLLCCVIALPSRALSAHDLETARAEPSTQWVTLTGYTRADVFFNLDSEFAGKVLEVYADIGDNIPEDGIFARLDATFVQLNLDAVTTEIEKLETQLEYYSKEADRYRKLVTKGNTDQSTYDKYQLEMDKGSFQLRSQKVEKARLEEELKRYVLRVPAGYTVIKRSIEPGEWISAGTNVGKFGDYRTLVIPFALDQAEFRALQAMPRLDVDIFPVKAGLEGPQHKEASIQTISPAFDEETRKIQVELAITPDALSNRGGLRAELRLPLPDRAGSVLLPEKFVSQKYEENFVIRTDGQRIPVVVLGSGPDEKIRVYSPKIKAGDSFALPLGEKTSIPANAAQ